MGVNTQKYIRKPLYVDAVRVTDKNFDEIVAWCQGEVEHEEVGRKGTLKKFIRVRVHNPKNPRQTKAFIGDWVLYTERGYKVYKDVPFREAFDLVADVVGDEVKLYIDPASGELIETPPHEGAKPLSMAELMNTIRSLQMTEANRVLGEETNQETDVQPIQEVCPGDDLGITPQGEQIEVVEATPQAIADAVTEQQPVELDKADADHKIEQVGQPEPVSDGIVPVEPEMLEDVPAAGTPIVPPEVASQPKPVSEQPPQDAAAGKYVLSQKEQADLGPEGVRELLASGEAVLAQDLAESA